MNPTHSNRWKIALGLAALVALGALVAPSLHAAVTIAPLVRAARWDWFLAALSCQLVMYLCVARILQASLASLKKPLSLSGFYVPAIVFLFANRAVPGPAVAGIAALVYLLRNRDVVSADAQITAGSFYLADYASFFVVLIFAAVTEIVGRGTVTLSIWPYVMAVGVISVICVLGIIAYASAERMISAGVRFVRRLESITKTNDEKRISEKTDVLLTGLLSQSRVLFGNPLFLANLVGTGVLMHALETWTLVCIARGLNADLTFGAAATSYVGGNLAAIISFLPGGIGLYDGAMVALLHTLGHLSLPAAGATTILYRFLSLAVPFPFAIGVIHRSLVPLKPR